MDAILGLLVHLRIEIRVKDDDSVSHLKIETVTSGPGTQQKDFLYAFRICEDLHVFGSVILAHSSIQSENYHPSRVEEKAHEIKYSHELAEHERGVLQEADNMTAFGAK